MRKSPDIWSRWAVTGGNGLHLTQLKIAMQGARLLKVGGRMVYSTCTFNPVEDEAVVAALLQHCKGALQLVDVAGQLPQLKRLPGLKTWKVRARLALARMQALPLVRGARCRRAPFCSRCRGPSALLPPPCLLSPPKVRDRYQWYADWPSAATVGQKLAPSMFPPPPAAGLPLERCMRFLPHHNDTGGFFVAVLE